LVQAVEKGMIRHAGLELFENLEKNLQQSLSKKFEEKRPERIQARIS
jgi:hypothetical protein